MPFVFRLYREFLYGDSQGHYKLCDTLFYMTTLTIRIDDKLASELRKLTARTGKRKSEFAREALRRQLALERFNDLRRRQTPFAEAQGWLTDEDVFAEVS